MPTPDSIETLARITRVEGVVFVGLILLCVFFLALTGRIRLTGIFQDKTTGTFDPARLQLLVLTIFTASQLPFHLQAAESHGALGLPSGWLLALLGGSHGIYLYRKRSQVRASTRGG